MRRVQETSSVRLYFCISIAALCVGRNCRENRFILSITVCASLHAYANRNGRNGSQPEWAGNS